MFNRVLIYRPNFSGNRFRKPHIIAIGYLLFAILVTLYLSVWMSRENKRRDAVLAESKETEPLSSEERHAQGDKSLHYRYVI